MRLSSVFVFGAVALLTSCGTAQVAEDQVTQVEGEGDEASQIARTNPEPSTIAELIELTSTGVPPELTIAELIEWTSTGVPPAK